MKVNLQCAHCLLQRAVNQAKLATDDFETQMRVIERMMKFLSDNLTMESVPSHIGTERDLIVQEMTGKDPYAQLKNQSNEMALSILPDLMNLVGQDEEDKQQFRKAVLIAAAANAIEFDVSGRDFNLDELRGIIQNVEQDLAIDQIDEFMDLCLSSDEVLYLMDNAGEIVLDMILISQIKKLGPRVIAYVKSGPVLNDATMKDAEAVKLNQYADEVRDTGAAAIGVNLELNSKDFKEALFSGALIVAKGMGNYESMTEFEVPGPVVHILRTKCLPVANHVGVPLNKNVIMIRKP